MFEFDCAVRSFNINAHRLWKIRSNLNSFWCQMVTFNRNLKVLFVILRIYLHFAQMTCDHYRSNFYYHHTNNITLSRLILFHCPSTYSFPIGICFFSVSVLFLFFFFLGKSVGAENIVDIEICDDISFRFFFLVLYRYDMNCTHDAYCVRMWVHLYVVERHTKLNYYNL